MRTYSYLHILEFNVSDIKKPTFYVKSSSLLLDNNLGCCVPIKLIWFIPTPPPKYYRQQLLGIGVFKGVIKLR